MRQQKRKFSDNDKFIYVGKQVKNADGKDVKVLRLHKATVFEIIKKKKEISRFNLIKEINKLGISTQSGERVVADCEEYLESNNFIQVLYMNKKRFSRLGVMTKNLDVGQLHI